MKRQQSSPSEEPGQCCALVTGASSGIGQAIAEQLLTEGHRVIALARREERLQALKRHSGAASGLHIATADVRDKDAMRSVLRALPGDFAEIDVLINNAGLALGVTPAQESQFDDWQTMIDTNCTALAWLSRELLPAMLERGRGHIVNMGSIAGRYPYRGSSVYGASKAFVEQFSLNLRADLLGTPIRCTLIEPGMVGNSEFSLVRMAGNEAAAAAVYAGAEELTPESVASAVSYVINQPAHVNVNRIELMPVCQAADSIGVSRSS